MQDEKSHVLPFLVRDMLRFENSVSFSLQVRSQASVAGALTIRGMTREGTFTFKHTTVSTGAYSTDTFQIPDVPIYISVIDDGSIFKQGEVVVTLNFLGNKDILFNLANGFVYSNKPLSYPIPSQTDLIPGRGRFKTIVSDDPAAGDEISWTVPNGRVWRIIACSFQLVTAATVANRRVHLRLQTNAGLDISTFPDTDQVASLTRNYSFAQFGGSLDGFDGTKLLAPMPAEVYLETDDFLGTNTQSLQAGDNFGIGLLLVEEFFRSPA